MGELKTTEICLVLSSNRLVVLYMHPSHKAVSSFQMHTNLTINPEGSPLLIFFWILSLYLESIRRLLVLECFKNSGPRSSEILETGGSCTFFLIFPSLSSSHFKSFLFLVSFLPPQSSSSPLKLHPFLP